MDSLPFADEMDLVLHPARIDRKNNVTYEKAMDSLPDGSFVRIEEFAYLVWADARHGLFEGQGNVPLLSV